MVLYADGSPTIVNEIISIFDLDYSPKHRHGLGKCSTLRFVKSTKEGEPVHQDAPGSYYSPGALATLGPPSSAKNVGEFDTMAEELARLGSAHVYKLVCVGPLWGALHKVLVKVGPSDLAPPTIKLVTQAI
ncbi:hypothetical protein BHE74_00047604 [Ensete ventricosum]|nr:hypothetical protein GW17_00023663 [Ensete ventricosum]RWW46466.1 hypothetical protein BHE74_00047604 [Ensete ventricosum]